MTLLDVLDRNLIKVPLSSPTREKVIQELVNVYSEYKKLDEDEERKITSLVLEREYQASTALENSIAIPHAKIDGLTDPGVVIGVSRDGINFGSDEKSRLFFLVLIPAENPSEHVQLLSSIARICSSSAVTKLLIGAKSADELYHLIAE